jgi:ankyrin repeat protein
MAAPIYYASLGGLLYTVEMLLGKGANANAQGGRNRNPLQATSAEGHNDVMQLLLEKGANINA